MIEWEAPYYDGCCNCGDRDGVCATAGRDLYCGPCWDEYQAEKRAHEVAREKDKVCAVITDELGPRNA